MEDHQILELLFNRREEAITALEAKYGKRSMAIAVNILGSRQDAEECVSDAFRALWDSIPPERPERLWAYLSRVVRNLCYSRLDYLTAAKRDRGCEVCLSELEDVLAAGQDPEAVIESGRVADAINSFLDTLDRTSRIIFVRRYYYFDSCADIGKRVGLTRGAVNTRLYRIREDLREALEKEDIYV